MNLEAINILILILKQEGVIDTTNLPDKESFDRLDHRKYPISQTA